MEELRVPVPAEAGWWLLLFSQDSSLSVYMPSLERLSQLGRLLGHIQGEVVGSTLHVGRLNKNSFIPAAAAGFCFISSSSLIHAHGVACHPLLQPQFCLLTPPYLHATWSSTTSSCSFTRGPQMASIPPWSILQPPWLITHVSNIESLESLVNASSDVVLASFSLTLG